MITIITNNMIVIRYSECTANPQGEDDQDSSCTSAQLKVNPMFCGVLRFDHKLSGSSIWALFVCLKTYVTDDDD